MSLPALLLSVMHFYLLITASEGDEYKYKPNPMCKNSTAYNPATFTKNKAQTELFKAVLNNRPEMAMLFAAKGANINMRTSSGDTLLHVAVTCGSHEVLRSLLHVGLQPDVLDDLDLSAMWRAVEVGNIHALAILKKHGADIGFRCPELDNGTLLHEAARRGNENVVSWLLSAGGLGPDMSDNNGRTPLHLAAERGHLGCVKVLVDHGATVDQNDHRGRTPLVRPAKEGHEQVVKYLIERGANVKIRDDYGITPLHLAARNGHLNTVRLLVARGADLNAKDNDNETPLYWTAGGGHQNTLEELLNSGADISIRNKDRLTALHWAAASDRQRAVRALLDRGAPVNDKGAHNITPLHLAAAFGHIKVVRVLVEAGARLGEKDDKGRTAADMALAKGHTCVVELLREYDAKNAERQQSGNPAAVFRRQSTPAVDSFTEQSSSSQPLAPSSTTRLLTIRSL